MSIISDVALIISGAREGSISLHRCVYSTFQC